MDLITLDFETYYADDYTLSKMTTEAYIRDDRFEAIMVGVKVNNEPTKIYIGEQIALGLQATELHKHAVCAHHSHFDGLILSHHYGIKPKIWIDTIPMARAHVGSVAARGMSLAALAEYYGLPPKGHEVETAKNKHLSDFTPAELAAYGKYCANDVDDTKGFADRLLPHFSVTELRLIDITTRLFTEPLLEFDVPLLQEYKDQVVANKAFLLMRSGLVREDLTSNPKFAAVLEQHGIVPGMKPSPTAKNPDGTPKQTFAFAKTDPFMKQLLESDNETIASLAECRLGVKTSIAETRAQRYIDMGGRGAVCIYLQYWGAEQTGRHSARDKTNFLNLGRNKELRDYHTTYGASVITPNGRGVIAKVSKDGTRILTTAGEAKVKACHQIGLRDSLRSPLGYSIVVGDSANIEARMLVYLANQTDVLDKYRNNEDLYCAFGSDLFGRPITKADVLERQISKIAVLGLGFGMGAVKFVDTVRAWDFGAMAEQMKPLLADKALLAGAVYLFRDKYDMVKAWWKYCNEVVLPALAAHDCVYCDPQGLFSTTNRGTILLPSGRELRYPNLRQVHNDETGYKEWVFDVREGRRLMPTRIYGGKLCIAAGTNVLTDRGWVPIEQVASNDKVHDGVEFTEHGGIVCNSAQECVTVDGVHMTPDHEVLTNEGWKPALEKPRPYRPDLRGYESYTTRRQRRKENVVGVPVHLRSNANKTRDRYNERAAPRRHAELWVLDSKAAERTENARYEPPPCLLGVAQHVRPMQTPYASSVEKLRRARDTGVRAMAALVRELLGGYAGGICARTYARAQEQYARLSQGKLHMGYVHRTSPQQAQFTKRGRCTSDFSSNRDKSFDAVLSAKTSATARTVYDITNCGVRQRFVVEGLEGPFIVHNCENVVQAAARVVVMDQIVKISKRYRIVLPVYDEAVCCVPDEQAEECEKYIMQCLSETPAWAPNLPVAAETGIGNFYGAAK